MEGEQQSRWKRSSRFLIATFSIVGFDPSTGDLGVAVESRYFGVGTVVPWARAGVGAIATQAMANIHYGPEGLKLLESGASASRTLHELVRDDVRREERQVGLVDAHGHVAAFTGARCHEWAGHVEGDTFCVQGNLLTGESVLTAMAGAYQEARGHGRSELADWLMTALQAGQDAGGDRRGKQSAALLVVRENAGYGRTDRYIDLRVDDHPEPTDELARLLALHKELRAAAHRRKPHRPLVHR
jgi:uncharacterized Ntn-hydrolase superfamily protein